MHEVGHMWLRRRDMEHLVCRPCSITRQTCLFALGCRHRCLACPSLYSDCSACTVPLFTFLFFWVMEASVGSIQLRSKFCVHVGVFRSNALHRHSSPNKPGTSHLRTPCTRCSAIWLFMDLITAGAFFGSLLLVHCATMGVADSLLAQM